MTSFEIDVAPSAAEKPLRTGRKRQNKIIPQRTEGYRSVPSFGSKG